MTELVANNLLVRIVVLLAIFAIAMGGVYGLWTWFARRQLLAARLREVKAGEAGAVMSPVSLAFNDWGWPSAGPGSVATRPMPNALCRMWRRLT